MNFVTNYAYWCILEPTLTSQTISDDPNDSLRRHIVKSCQDGWEPVNQIEHMRQLVLINAYLIVFPVQNAQDVECFTILKTDVLVLQVRRFPLEYVCIPGRRLLFHMVVLVVELLLQVVDREDPVLEVRHNPTHMVLLLQYAIRSHLNQVLRQLVLYREDVLADGRFRCLYQAAAGV